MPKTFNETRNVKILKKRRELRPQHNITKLPAFTTIQQNIEQERRELTRKKTPVELRK